MQERDLQNLIDTLRKAEAGQDVSKENFHTAVDKLTEDQKTKMNELLQDPNKMKKLLESPIAKKIMSDLQGK